MESDSAGAGMEDGRSEPGDAVGEMKKIGWKGWRTLDSDDDRPPPAGSLPMRAPVLHVGFTLESP
jgi:hypothetical protein